MKKSVLTLAALAISAMAANAAAPSAADLAKYNIRIDFIGDSINYPTTGKTTVTYATEGNTGTINIAEPSGLVNLKANVDWTAGKLTMAPQMCGMDEDTYDYLMIVPAADKAKNPTEIYSSKMGGTAGEAGITFGPWNLIRTDFSTNKGTVYANDINTRIVKANATVKLGRLTDDNDDYTYAKGEELEMPAFAEQNGNRLTVYNFDEMGACLVLDLNGTNCTAKGNEVVYRRNARQTYTAVALDPSIIGSESVVRANNPDVAGTIEGKKVIKLGYFGLLRTTGTADRGLYYSATITLDNELNITSTGIDSNVAGKQVASEVYYNLAGMASAQPFSGVNVKVTTYTDGSKKAEKVVR